MSDADWMLRCLELARQGEGTVAPNPMVGAVVVRDGEVLAEGYHVAPGLDHAEPAALRKLDFSAPGATMYVNLEPCCHHGRTPPCTDAILRAGIRRVVVGMVDPFPQVAGEGIRLLREAGVEVTVGVEEEACRALNAGYLSSLNLGRPRVWLKAGVTLDGRIADGWGASRWITSDAARARAHQLRARCDAVMVGSGTLLADDPSLNTRLQGGRDALPVVIDSGLRISANAKVLTAGRRPVVFCGPSAPDRPELAADVVRVGLGEGGLDLAAVLGELDRRGVHNLLVEGGGRLARSLLDAGLVDRLVLFVAPKLLAGGPGFIAGPAIPLADAPEFAVRTLDRVGPDVVIELDRVPKEA